ncbi:MAG: aminotransferase class V-fold PLP-dependent enzyme [Clostridia bacterium]|nr:aminotransferase class V-fold PLP-dependent enzyme [Clostridia bacterium]
MLSFENDYSEGAHPLILKRLSETNLEQMSGYGTDPICESARSKIRDACGTPLADVFFLTGGTQANRTVIASMLKPFEGVISAETGHIGVHEAGAVENSGHKVITLSSENGKLKPERVSSYLKAFFSDANHEHMAFPGMVYISFPTELGTLYSKAELTALNGICREFGLPLFIDGARLGYGLMSRECDVTLPELASLCDVLYIGGTKVGALLGEAVVFPKGDAPAHFMTMVKQNGALLAKGRLLGIQFDTLFTDGLYFKIARNAIDMAEELKAMLIRKNITFYLQSPTNQQFVILEDSFLEELRKYVVFSFWEKYDETHSVIRLATSWATQTECIEALDKLL